MQAGKMNFVFDAYWGSSGKGKVAAFLADKYKATDLSTSNGPNAGHTVDTGEERVVFKCLPSATAVTNETRLWLGPSSVFDYDRLRMEVERARKRATHAVIMHSHATELTEDDKLGEQEQESLTAIGSTAQGTMWAKQRKMSRQPYGIVGEDSSFHFDAMRPDEFYSQVHDYMKAGMWLHEIAQGYLLSLDHGQYPYVTSRNCTVQAAIDDFQVAPKDVGSVYMIVRAFPIRVGNGGGFSGPFMPYASETTWEEIISQAGMTEEQSKMTMEYEHTTVTKRLRRVGKIHNFRLLGEIARKQGVTDIVLNFGNYVDAKIWGATERSQLTDRVMDYVDCLQDATGVRVSLIGTGPEQQHMVSLV